ncbi:rod shape-determining protein MreC [Megalodesulfovibrio paquesii]
MTTLWRRYIYLVGLSEENETLKKEVHALSLELMTLREDAAESARLRELLSFKPPPAWRQLGARVVAQRLGPYSALESLLVDQGSADGVRVNTPAITPQGVAGRVLRVSPSAATILLLVDANSKIAVMGQDSRAAGILEGHGVDQLMELSYVPLTSEVKVGERLVTSGLAGIFPKGVPVAEVVSVSRSDISLFQQVLARPYVNVTKLEELILLMPDPNGADSLAEPGEDGEEDVLETALIEALRAVNATNATIMPARTGPTPKGRMVKPGAAGQPGASGPANASRGGTAVQ